MHKLIVLMVLIPLFSFGKTYDQIKLKVNNKIVTLQDIERFKNLLKATTEIHNLTDDLLNQQIINILILEYFTEEKKIEITEKDITREIFTIMDKQKIETEEKLRQELSKQFKYEVTEIDLRDYVKKQLTTRKAQEYIIFHEKRDQIKIPTDEEIKDFYEKNKLNPQFVQMISEPIQVKIAHLVIQVKETDFFKDIKAKEKILTDTKEKALKIEIDKFTLFNGKVIKGGIIKVENEKTFIQTESGQIVIDNKDIKEHIKPRENYFYEQVEKYASPIYKKNKGLLGYFDYEKLYILFPKYTDVLKLKPGDVSDIIVTDYGRLIIMLMEKKGGELIEFNKIKPRIEQVLMFQKGKEIFEEWYKDYAKTFTIVIN